MKKAKSRRIGPLRIRPYARDGEPTLKWMLDIPASVTGTGRRKRRLYPSEKEAAAVARALKTELELRLIGFGAGRRAGRSFAQVTAEWVELQESRVRTLKVRSATLKATQARLRPLLARFGDLDLVAVTEERLTAYQELRLGQGRKPATVNAEVRLVLQILRFAIRKGYLEKLPVVEGVPVQRPPAVIPTKAEVRRFMACLPADIAPLAWFIAETGCRLGEALHLTWDRLDEVNGVIEFAPTQIWQPKTTTSCRKVYVRGALLTQLRNLDKAGPFVFVESNPAGRRSTINRAFVRASAAAQIMRHGKPVRITPHVLRKAHATWLAMEGVPHQVLQAHLGHARGSRVTDQHYVFATEEAQRAAVVELPLENLSSGDTSSAPPSS